MALVWGLDGPNCKTWPAADDMSQVLLAAWATQNGMFPFGLPLKGARAPAKTNMAICPKRVPLAGPGLEPQAVDLSQGTMRTTKKPLKS